MRNMMMKRHHGFTLVELLVVIAIISVLAALLLPTIERAIGLAQTTECMDRMRQVSLVCELYSTDYYGTVLPAFMTTARRYSGAEYDKVGVGAEQLMYLGGYLPPEDVKCNVYTAAYEGAPGSVRCHPRVPNRLVESSILLCPNSIYIPNTGVSAHAALYIGYGSAGSDYSMTEYYKFCNYGAGPGKQFPYNYMSVFSSFGFNDHMTRKISPNVENGVHRKDYYIPRKIKEIKRPSSTIHFMDFGRGNRFSLLNWDTLQGSLGSYPGLWTFRHADTMPYACVDGHVAAFGPDMKDLVYTVIPTLSTGYKTAVNSLVKQEIMGENYDLTLGP